MAQAPTFSISCSRALGTTRARPAERSQRLSQLDAARVIATLGVVWVHVAERHELGSPSSALGRFGTSFYIIAAVLLPLLAAASGTSHDTVAVLRRRSRSVLRPFVIWSLIYGAIYGAWAMQGGASWQALARWWGPLAGTAIHLWFLPFAVVIGVIASATGPWLLRCRTRWLLLGTPVAALLAYRFFHGYAFLRLDRRWLWEWHLHRLDRWLEELPLVTLALGLSAVWVQHRGAPYPQHRNLCVALVAAAGFVAAQCLYFSSFAPLEWPGASSRLISHLAGMCLTLAALSVGTVLPVRWLAALGKHTYFVFLAHLLVLELLGSLPTRLPRYGSAGVALLITLGIFASCVLLSLVARTSRALRWLSP